MTYRSQTPKVLSMTVAALTGAALCGVFTMVLFATGALAAI